MPLLQPKVSASRTRYGSRSRTWSTPAYVPTTCWMVPSGLKVNSWMCGLRYPWVVVPLIRLFNVGAWYVK